HGLGDPAAQRMRVGLQHRRRRVLLVGVHGLRGFIGHVPIISAHIIAHRFLRNRTCGSIIDHMTTTAPVHRLTHNGRYITWLISDTAKGLASALVGFAIPLIALFVTDDPAQAGIISAVGMTVRTLTTVYGGVLADRHRRILMMVTGSAIGVVLAVAFTMLALG